MKKDFKAPVIEAKEFNALNSIMDSNVLSANVSNPKGMTSWSDSQTTEDYKQWKKQ